MSQDENHTASLYPKSGSVHIETNDYLLRTITPEDINERILSWYTNPEMLTGLNLASLNFDVAGLKTIISNFDNKNNYFIGIFSKKDRLLIGFYTIDVNFPDMVGILTAGIGEKNYEGKPVLWKTIDPLLDYFYQNRAIYKFCTFVLERNLRMLFNFKNSTRFELEAVLKKECAMPSGERTDLLVFTSFCDDGRKPAVLDHK